MAYVFIEGFDYYNTINEALLGSLSSITNDISNTTFANGFFQHGRALAVKNVALNSNLLVFDLSTSLTEFFFKADVMIEANPTSWTEFLTFNEGSTNHTNLVLLTNGNIELRRSGSILSTTTTPPFPLNQRFRLEVRCLIADTGGIFEVRVDGVSVASLTNVDTRNGGTGIVNRFQIRGLTHGNNIGFTYYDNVTINNTTGDPPTSWPGARRIETIFPDADNLVQWQRSTGGLNYDLVNDVAIDPSRYVFSATAGDIDRYGFANLSGTPTSIDAVQLVYHAMRTDLGARTVRGFIRSGTAQVNGSTETPTVSPTGRYYRVTAHQDPNTSSPWSATAVNAIEGGVEIVS